MTRRTDALTDAATETVIGADAYRERLSPDSGLGRGRAASLSPYRPGERRPWRRELARLRTCETWVNHHPGEHARLRRALGELPRPTHLFEELQTGTVLGDSRLFELKHFLYFAREILEAAAPDLLDDLSAQSPVDRLSELIDQLHPGGSASPRFHLDGSLDDELRDAREHLRAARNEVRERRDELERAVAADLDGSFDLEGHFHPSPRMEEGELEGDGRLQRGEDGWRLDDRELEALQSRTVDAQQRVSRAEHRARRRVCREIEPAVPWLRELAAALAQLDLRLAKVRLKEEIEGCWPSWSPSRTAEDAEQRRSGWPAYPVLTVEAGRPPRLIDASEDLQPVDFRVGPQPAVVTGPNMGGKSMLLATLGLCQWAAQHALPVPAEDCRFRPVESIIYAGGELPGTPDGRGLSTFGREVRRIVEHLDQSRPPSLWLLDELGRGTHPRDGAAFAADVLRRLDRAGHRTVTATHFPAVADVARASIFRIAGLVANDDREVLADVVSLEDLHRRMDYQPHPAERHAVPRDARSVARALGWPPERSPTDED